MDLHVSFNFQKMLRWQAIFLFIYLKTLSQVTTSSVVDPDAHPPNVVVTVGHLVTFPLTYSLCNWDRNVNNDLVAIYRPSDNVSVSSKYSMNLTVAGQCDLSIKNVTFFDAGLYQYGNGDAYGFEVFVIDEKPVCFVEPDGTGSSGNGNVSLGCSLTFSHRDKKLAPILKWQLMLTEHDKSLRSGKETTARGADHDTVTSFVILPSGTPINNVVCFAQLGGIPASSSDDKVAQNRISFDGHCQIGRIEIPAKNIRIQNDMNMKKGEKIVCTADGYPEVKYYWTKDGVPIREGPDVMLDDEGLHAYKCFAYNYIQGQNHSASAERLILVQQGDENENVSSLVLSILAVLGVVGIIMTLLVLWRKRRPRNKVPAERTPAYRKPRNIDENTYHDETSLSKISTPKSTRQQSEKDDSEDIYYEHQENPEESSSLNK